MTAFSWIGVLRPAALAGSMKLGRTNCPLDSLSVGLLTTCSDAKTRLPPGLTARICSGH